MMAILAAGLRMVTLGGMFMSTVGALRGAKGGFAYPFDSEFYLCFYFVLSAIDMELADYVLRQLGSHPRSWTNG